MPVNRESWVAVSANRVQAWARFGSSNWNSRARRREPRRRPFTSTIKPPARPPAGRRLAYHLTRRARDRCRSGAARYVLCWPFPRENRMFGRGFRDRREAGQRLAERLDSYAGRDDTIVLALPRGGVPVGF